MVRILCVMFLVVSCGSKEIKENPTNCAVKEVPEGVEFSCVDKNGVASSGVVKHGEPGAKGEPGPAGEAGKGLQLKVAIECKGSVESWMKGASYEIEYHLSQFETGDMFASSITKLVRDQEVINQRSASGFFLTGSPIIHDGLFSLEYAGNVLNVQSKGGIKAQLPCEEV